MNIEQVARKKRWSEAEGRFVVEAWRRSGLRPTDFARKHGLHDHRLDRWRQRCKEADSGSKSAFVPVVVKDPRGARSREGVELVLTSGVVVRVPGSADVAWIGELVGALEGRRC